MKKIFTLFLFIFCLIPFVSGCTPKKEDDTPPVIENPDENDNKNNNENNNQNTPLEVKNGTEVAKILLANERLDESVLEKSGTLFTDGKKAMARIIDKTRQYLKRDAGRPNETYTEVDGDTYKWYNDVDYSNFISFFESYAVNIESSAENSARLIEYTKKYIRVVNKWVKQYNQEYFLVVDENSEIIINRENKEYINICKRYTDEKGNSVYEMLQSTSETVVRMKYIPNLLYEFAIQPKNDDSAAMYLNADNSKGYWTIFCSNAIQSYENYEGQTIENITPTIVVLKDEANYKLNYHVDTNGKGDIYTIDIISSDSKTDLISLGVDRMEFYNTGIRGLDHLEIIAPKDKVGDYDPDSEEELYVYEQNNTDRNGNKYKIYSTSGYKSATAVLENGMTLTENDMLLDGKVTIARIDVSYVAGCDSYGIIPIHTTAKNYDEQFEILEQFLELTGITFRRDFNDVINGLKYALKDVKSFTNYFTWNGYHLDNIELVKEAVRVEQIKTKELINLYDQVKDLEIIDIENQEQYNANIHFADIIITNPGTITNDEFTVSINDFTAKVEDTLLFVDKETYKIVFALLNKEGNLVSFLGEEDLFTTYTKGNLFETTQTKNFEIGILEEGEYTLVAYVALANEGIRVTNYTKVFAEINETTRTQEGYKTTIKSNENKELVIVSEIDYNVYFEFEGDFTYEQLKEFMGQTAYNHGMIDEFVIEIFDGENWIVVEEPIVEEELLPEQPTEGEEAQPEQPIEGEELETEESETPEIEEVIETLEKGQYRMKYIVSSEVEEDVYIYVTIK